jgi:hypothetical protein
VCAYMPLSWPGLLIFALIGLEKRYLFTVVFLITTMRIDDDIMLTTLVLIGMQCIISITA